MSTLLPRRFSTKTGQPSFFASGQSSATSSIARLTSSSNCRLRIAGQPASGAARSRTDFMVVTFGSSGPLPS